jgi:hypothetical protein
MFIYSSKKEAVMMGNTMKRGDWLLAVAIAFAVAVCLIVGQGCATTKEGSAYDVIYTAAITYDTLLTFAADQYAKGLMTEEQKESIVTLATRYRDAITAAQQALRIYKVAEIRAQEGEMKDAHIALLAAVDAMNAARDVLAGYLTLIEPEGDEISWMPKNSL